MDEGSTKWRETNGGESINGKDNKDEGVTILKEWLQKQTNLPKEVDEALLRQMIYRCNGSIEKTKSRLEAYFCLRTEFSEFFTGRNPFSRESQTAYQTMVWAPLPNKTPQGNVVYVYRLKDIDTAKFSLEALLRLGYMDLDELARKPNGKRLHGNLPVEGLIFVFDLSGFTMAHLAKMPLSLISKTFTYLHVCSSDKVREAHVLSSSSVTDKILTFFRPLIRRIDKLHIHPVNNLEQLHKYIPKKILPEEYGGEEESLEVLHERRRADVEEFSDWFSKEESNHRVTQETLIRWRKGNSWGNALGQSDTSTTFGVDGSFRKLCLD